jgi:uncharacterized protein (DUF1697 family)
VVYIALLRGINVGGHVVKMERLRQLFGELGFTDVRSYIQSGNVFFDTRETDRTALERRIEERLREALGYAVPACLRTVAELKDVVASDAFQDVEVTPDVRLCVVFSAEPIPHRLVLPLRSPKGDMEILRVTGRDAFMTWRIVDGRPPAFQSFLEKTVGGRVTTRFFGTAAKILEAAKKG